jgi:hypothetical protein
MTYDQMAFIASGYIHSDYRDAATATKPEIGQTVPDGTVYAGISPYDGLPMFATAQTSPYRIEEEAQYASTLKVHGHADYRVPTREELNVLYQNKDKGALKGTFNDQIYRSSSVLNNNYAWCQSFSNGDQAAHSNGIGFYVRCVRSGASFDH